MNFKKDFPILSQKVKEKKLVYLDNAATSQKPIQVIDAISNFYKTSNANIHRGVHKLSEIATEKFEETRKNVKSFINASSEKEIIFTKGCTESINIVAKSWGEENISEGDEIITSILEHHSNLIPWQELTKRKKANLEIIGITKNFELDLNQLESTISEKTKLVALSGMSNSLGSITNIERVIEIVRKKSKAKILIDGAQLICHQKVDLQKLDIDFFTFSAHKMLGPTGVGILYGKEEILESMHPFLYGGEMIKTVSKTNSKYADLPYKFEGGTPNISGVIAFNEAINYLKKIGYSEIEKIDQNLVKKCVKILKKYQEVTALYSEKNMHASILSFSIKNAHPHDIASIFNEYGIAIRSGNHCTEPLMKELNLTGGTARMSFYFYNQEKDLETIEEAIKKVIEIFC